MPNYADWVKLVFNETPTKAVVKQGFLFDEGDFYRIVGDNTETLVRKIKVISITKKKADDKKIFAFRKARYILKKPSKEVKK